MVLNNNKHLILVATVIVLVGFAAVAVGTISATESVSNYQGEDTQGETVDSVEISDALADTNGTETVVLRLEDADSGVVATSSDPVDTLQQHADQSQADVQQFADTNNAVEIKSTHWITNAMVLEVDTDHVSVDELASIDGVDRVHENMKLEAPMPTNSTDAETDEGHIESLDSEHSNTTYGVDMVNAKSVWEEYDTKGEGVRIAVLDTGVDVTHPDIELYSDDPQNPTYPGGWANFTLEGDKIEDDTPDDLQGHGTHVSGTVAGGNASGEYIGVAPEAELMHGAVLEEDGSGSFAQITAGLEWAVEEDADIISMSLGADGVHPELIDPVEHATDAGVIVIAASGNEGEGTSGSPSNYYNTMSVGAVDENASVTGFSGGMEVSSDYFQGQAPEHWPDEYIVPDVVAPGDDVLSAYPGGDYQELPGTSMATPHVSGSAALMLSATSTDVSSDRVEDTLIETSWKPSEAPDEQDVRYGHGIVDAQLAVATLRGDTGVTGTVERAEDEARIPNAEVTVNLDDGTELTTETDNLGTYSIKTPPGTHEVMVDVEGYTVDPIEADIEDGTFETAHFEMDRTLETVVEEEAPSAVESGESFEIVYHKWHTDSLVLEREGDFEEDVTVTVETDEMFSEEEIEFGEPFEFDNRTDDDFAEYPGELILTVHPEEPTDEENDSAGEIVLEAEFEGQFGENTSETHGPTDVRTDESIDVAVLSDPIIETSADESEKELGPSLVDRLDKELEEHHNVELVRGADSVLGDVDEYDVYVVQDEPSTDDMRQFVEETEGTDVGVVYLDQRDVANGITKLSEATGDPRGVHTPMPIDNSQIVSYDGSETDTEILEVEVTDDIDEYLDARGWPDDYEHVPFRQQEVLNFIEDHRGEDLAPIANERCDFIGCEPRNIDNDAMTSEYGDVSGLGVDELSRTVIASGLAETNTGIILNEGSELLANTVHWAADEQGVSIESQLPWKMDSGETDEIEVTVPTSNESETDEPLESVTIELNEYATVDNESLSIAVVDDEGTYDIDLGESFEPTVDNKSSIQLVVGVDDGAFGELTFDHTYEVGNETISGTTGPTSVYEGDKIRVSDGEDLQHAIDTVHVGDEVVVENGTYDPVWITPDNVDVTLRAAEGAEPKIVENERYDSFTRVGLIEVSADGVTVDGFTINTTGQSYNNGIGVRHTMHEAVEDVTVENMRLIEPYQGVWAGSATGQANDLEVRNVEVEEPFWAGVRLHQANDAIIEEVTVTEPGHNGVEVDELSENAVVKDSEFIDPEEAGVLIGIGTATIENNYITGAENGVEQQSTGVSHVSDNNISDSNVGVDFTLSPTLHADPTWNATAVDNKMETDTGIKTSVLGELDYADDEPVHIRGNDLSSTDVGVNDAEDGMMGAVDARLNYFGPHGPAAETSSDDTPVVMGEVVADPFLPDDSVEYENAGVATSVEIEAGETHAVGVPGVATGTIDDMVTDTEGVIYGFDAEASDWTQLHGDDTVDTLEAIIVVAETDGAITMNFESDTDTPTSPEATELEQGWNFVAAPTYASAHDAFGSSSGEISLVDPRYDGPSSEPGVADDVGSTFSLEDETVPNVSAFTGYFVFAEDDGTLPARMGENPTLGEFSTELRIQDDFEGSNVDSGESDDAYFEVLNQLSTESTAVVPDEHHDVLIQALATETAEVIADVPKNETDTFSEAAADELNEGLTEGSLEDEDAVIIAVEEALNEAAVVSIGKETEGNDVDRSTDPELLR